MDEIILKFSKLFSEEGFECHKTLDFSDLGGTNCFCSEESFEEIRNKLSFFGAGGLAWIDTGDYHYVSAIRASFSKVPFALLLLDNHTDDQVSELDCGVVSCGNWVNYCRNQLPNCKFELNPELPLFISLDLDILDPGHFLTNWNQGSLSPVEVMDLIDSAIGKSAGLLGVDVCGGLTVSKGADDAVLIRNRQVREIFREFFSEKRFL